MRVTENLMAEAAQMLAKNIETIESAKIVTSISCAGCGAGCSGIVGGD